MRSSVLSHLAHGFRIVALLLGTFTITGVAADLLRPIDISEEAFEWLNTVTEAAVATGVAAPLLALVAAGCDKVNFGRLRPWTLFALGVAMLAFVWPLAIYVAFSGSPR